MASRMLVSDLERKFDGAIQELREVEQILGEALGYPRYMDDQKNFPGASEEDGVCVGEMTPALLAKQLAADHKLLTEQNTSFLVQAMAKGTKLAEAEKKLAQLTQTDNRKDKKMTITHTLKVDDAFFFIQPEDEEEDENARWHPASVEVDFLVDADGEVKITCPTRPEIIFSMTVDEWRSVTDFIKARMIAHGNED